jgi:carbonic anhydrase/acetyltransferase-like protein (isoleucine patch superfamily)
MSDDAMPLYALGSTEPTIAPSAYVAANATVIGNVILGEQVSIWFGAILRGDNEPIRVGDHSNVQEVAVLHTDPGYPLSIGSHVTVGHQSILHGCTIGDGSLIGIQAVVLNGAVIGQQCLVGAGTVVTERKIFPDRSLILGTPAKVVRELTSQELAALRTSAEVYVRRAHTYRESLRPILPGA